MFAANPPLNSLGFAKPPGETRVVVAMSGGVDSSVVAALLKQEGYDVIGITLQLYDQGAAQKKKGACCAGKDVADAQAVAAKLNIPHYVLDYESRFREDVVQDFADTYAAGRTPIPCVRCNQTVKFRDLMTTAKELGAEALATGHYVRRADGAHGPELLRAADESKDQSYFLFATTQEQLALLRFPLGGKSKSETRELAANFGLIVAFKPDSQDICFVPNGSYAAIVEKLRPDAARAGNLVHIDGRVLGRHEGIIHYTIGQRKGIGIGGGVQEGGEALYVVAVDAARAEVTVGPRAALARDIVQVHDVNWLGDTRTELPVEVKLRSGQAAVPATLIRDATSRRATVTLDQPIYGIAPGQACVFYEGARVLGGGWIDSAESRQEAA